MQTRKNTFTWFIALLFLALLAACDGTSGSSGSTATVPTGPPLPLGAVRIADAPDDVALRMALGLHRDEAGLSAAALRVTNPASPDYRAWLTPAEVTAEFGAPQGDVELLLRSLEASGVAAEVNSIGSHIIVHASVRQAENLFGVTWGVYQSPMFPPSSFPDGELKLPEGWRELVREIFGLSGSAEGTAATTSLRAAAAANGATPWRTGTAEGCPEALALSTTGGQPSGFMPNQFRTAYGIDELHAAGLQGQGARIAVLEYQGYLPSDVDVYSDCFGLPRLNQVIHGENSEIGGAEAILDLQIIAAVAPRAERVDVFIFDSLHSTYTEQFSALIDPGRMGGKLPHVISWSYGFCELVISIQGKFTDNNGAAHVVTAAAAMGVGIYVASGDSGSSSCTSSDPLIVSAYVPWPASLPFVVAIGGTGITLNQDNTIQSEGVWNDRYYEVGSEFYRYMAGGGGESTLYQRPSWQHGPGISPGDARLVPDAALFGDSSPGYAIYCTPGHCQDGEGWFAVGGTSAATPLFAGAMALIAQEAAETIQPTPGFVAPALYEIGRNPALSIEVFNDITVGSNDLYGFHIGLTPGVECCVATEGFDMASGLGSVNFPALRNALLGP